MSNKEKSKLILFVCTGNTCRSPIAEWYFNNKSQKKNIDNYLIADSAGISTIDGLPASDNSIAVMEEIGVDLNTHLAQQITNEMVNNAYLVLTMSESHKLHLTQLNKAWTDKIFTLKEFTNETKNNDIDIFDPYGSNIKKYRKVRNTIISCVDKLFYILVK